MAALVLGPFLRSVEGDAATVWVEVDTPCEVVVEAGPATGRATTTAVQGRHYALVVVSGLPPATATPYRVTLDGEQVWPTAGSDRPPSVIRTADGGRPVRVTFGSCRLEAPLDAPWDHGPDDADPGHGVDALDALAEELRTTDVAQWPDLLALIGDQLYADLVVHDPPVHDGPAAPPPGSLADLADYVRLYRRTWGHASVRWLLSTVPTAMVFDDHDVVDDWNLSARWLDEIAREPWWDDRIAGGLVSYWLYQHWGNLSPSQLAVDGLARAVADADDATDLLFGHVDGWRLDRPGETATRWSTARDLAGTGTARLVLADTRNRRHLVEGAGDARRGRGGLGRRPGPRRLGRHRPPAPRLVDPVAAAPRRAPPRALGRGPGGRALGAGRAPLRRVVPGRQRRRALAELRPLVRCPGRAAPFGWLGRAGGGAGHRLLVLSGDVHFSYLAPADVGDGVSARVVQLVSSPLRHGVPRSLRRKLLLAMSRVGRVGGRAVRLTAAPGGDPVRWRLTAGPWFGNGLAALELDGRQATVTFSRSVRAADGRPVLERVHREHLTT